MFLSRLHASRRSGSANSTGVTGIAGWYPMAISARSPTEEVFRVESSDHIDVFGQPLASVRNHRQAADDDVVNAGSSQRAYDRFEAPNLHQLPWATGDINIGRHLVSSGKDRFRVNSDLG